MFRGRFVEKLFLSLFFDFFLNNLRSIAELDWLTLTHHAVTVGLVIRTYRWFGHTFRSHRVLGSSNKSDLSSRSLIDIEAQANPWLCILTHIVSIDLSPLPYLSSRRLNVLKHLLNSGRAFGEFVETDTVR